MSTFEIGQDLKSESNGFKIPLNYVNHFGSKQSIKTSVNSLMCYDSFSDG